MSDKLDIITLLGNFGLNEVESYIYLHLVNKKPLSITQISKDLNLPRTSIHDNSQKLISKGLLERVMRYKSQLLRAYPLEILETLIEKEKEKITSLNANLKQLQKLIHPSLLNDIQTQVRYYEGVQGFRQMMWNSLSADKEIIGYTIYGRSEIVGQKFVDKYVKEFKARGLRDRTIFNNTKESWEHIKKILFSDKHQQTKDDARFLTQEELYISGDTSIYNNIFAVCYWKHGEVVGVEIENPELVRNQKSIFELLWKVARPIIELKD